MEVTLNQLAAMAGSAPNDNMKSVHLSLTSYGATYGLDRPHRLAQFLAQLLHESGNFRYDRELWGNTKAQLRYDTRTGRRRQEERRPRPDPGNRCLQH